MSVIFRVYVYVYLHIYDYVFIYEISGIYENVKIFLEKKYWNKHLDIPSGNNNAIYRICQNPES